MTRQDHLLAPAGRISGLDLARGLAVTGMFAAHVLILGDFDWSDPITWGGVVDGRSAATFALLAGVSIAIISGGDRPVNSVALTQARVRIFVRAALIFLIGGVLDALGTNVYIILQYYAVMFVLALPVLRWRSRSLFLLAGMLAVVSPIAQLVLSRVLTGVGLFETAPFTLLVTGAYPAIVWFVFVLVGIGIGRLDLRRRDIHLKILGVGVILAVIGYTAGSLAATLPQASLEQLPEERVTAESLFDLTSLLTALPHTGTPFELVGATGFALALVALCLIALRPGVGRVLRTVLFPLTATGSMALSAYSVQILALAVIGDGYWVTGSDNAGLYLTLTLSIVLGCTLWSLFVGRGPLERLLTITSRNASVMVTRSQGNSPDEPDATPEATPDRAARPE
jgi:uncharacterized protein